ncbi:MAG: hypothetical protein WC641_05930 [Patescibacteria group bacterium]
MQLQNFAAEKRPLAERIEGHEIPPEKLAAEMLREGDRNIAEMRSRIQDLKRDDVLADFKQYEAELDAAWDDLKAEVTTAQTSSESLFTPEGWDMAEAEPTRSVEEFSGEAREILSADKLDFDRLEAVCAEAERSDEKRLELTDFLEGQVGKKFAGLILRDAEYRKSVKDLYATLDAPLGEDGPPLMAELKLQNLIAVKELFGDNARRLAKAMDLKRRNPELKYRTESTIMVKEFSLDHASGELTGARVDIGMICDHAAGGDATIFRNFFYAAEKQADGSFRAKKSVNHELLEFPESMKQNGLAANITRDCLKEYDVAGIEEITLHANIDTGGYSWASYGYGWNEEVMGLKKFQDHEGSKASASFDEKKYGAELKTLKPDIKPEQIAVLTGERRAKIGELAREQAVKKFAALSPEEKLKPHLEKVSDLAEGGMLSFVVAAQEAGILDDERKSADPRVMEIIQAFEEAIAHPENVTPQTLALLGKNGPTLRKGASNHWYTEEAFATALQAGEDEELPDYKGGFHAGKLGLMSSSWYGKIDLKPDSPQAGENRKLLEKKINRTT